MGGLHSFQRTQSYVDLIDYCSYATWQATVNNMFSDGNFNKGRLYVLKIFTDDMIVALRKHGKWKQAYSVRHRYLESVKDKAQYHWLTTKILDWFQLIV